MFFDSLIRRKQTVFTSTAPNFDTLSQTKQVYSPSFEPKREFNSQKIDSRMLITRSKSERQLNHNIFQGHLPHPILHKDKGLNQIAESHLRDKGQYISRERQQMKEKQKPVMCNKHKKTIQSNKNAQILQGTNEYDFRNGTKTPSSQKFGFQNEGSSIISEFSSQLSQLKESTNNQNFDRDNAYGQQHLYKSQDRNMITPLGMEKSRKQYLDNQVTKLIDTEYENSLRSTVRSLQKQIILISEQRDKDKNKLLQYSLNVDKLKTENEMLKKSSSKSKENVDVRGRTQINELKKARENLLKQKQTALYELNQALNNQEMERSKWEKEKKGMQNRIDSLTTDCKQKSRQNILLGESVNGLCEKNKNLREDLENMQRELRQKQNQTKWMTSKVNELKQALEYIKLHGNSRIMKLEEELMAVESKRKQSTQSQLKSLQSKLKQKEDLIQYLRSQKRQQQNSNKESQQIVSNLKTTISTLQKKNEMLNKQVHEKSKQIEDLRELHQQSLHEKNKTIQILNKNLFSLNDQKQELKEEKKLLEQEILAVKSERNTVKERLSIVQFQLNQEKLKAERYAKQKQKILLELNESNQIKQTFNSKIKSLQLLNKSISAQLEGFKRDYSSIFSQKGSQQNQIGKLRNQKLELSQQKLDLLGRIEHQQRVISDKNKQLQKKESQILSIHKQLLYAKQEIKILNRKKQTSQNFLEQKQKLIKRLNQQILTANTKLKSQQNEVVKHIQVQNVRKVEEQAGKVTYSQLEMRICSILGIYLTNSIDKIISSIEDLVRLKRIYEPRNKFYEQILKIFDVRDSESSRLIMEIKQVKNGRHHMISLEQETSRYKEENTYLMDRVQWAACLNKKMEGILDQHNQIIVKLRLNLLNEKYNQAGVKKF